MFGPTNRKFQGMETAVPPSALRTLCGVPGYPLKCSKSFSLPLPHGPTFFFIWNFYPFSFTSFAVGKREEESFHIFSPSSPQKRYISYFLDLSLHEVWCSSDVVENGACFSPTTVHWRFCWRVACNFPLPKKLVFFPPIFVPLWGGGLRGGLRIFGWRCVSEQAFVPGVRGVFAARKSTLLQCLTSLTRPSYVEKCLQKFLHTWGFLGLSKVLIHYPPLIRWWQGPYLASLKENPSWSPSNQFYSLGEKTS